MQVDQLTASLERSCTHRVVGHDHYGEKYLPIVPTVPHTQWKPWLAPPLQPWPFHTYRRFDLTARPKEWRRTGPELHPSFDTVFRLEHHPPGEIRTHTGQVIPLSGILSEILAGSGPVPTALRKKSKRRRRKKKEAELTAVITSNSPHLASGEKNSRGWWKPWRKVKTRVLCTIQNNSRLVCLVPSSHCIPNRRSSLRPRHWAIGALWSTTHCPKWRDVHQPQRNQEEPYAFSTCAIFHSRWWVICFDFLGCFHPFQQQLVRKLHETTTCLSSQSKHSSLAFCEGASACATIRVGRIVQPLPPPSSEQMYWVVVSINVKHWGWNAWYSHMTVYTPILHKTNMLTVPFPSTI